MWGRGNPGQDWWWEESCCTLLLLRQLDLDLKKAGGVVFVSTCLVSQTAASFSSGFY